MRATVSTREPTPIRLGVRGIDDIVQCLHTLLTTIRGTVFLDRRLGVEMDVIDEPLNSLGSLYQSIYFQIEEYEPRVEVLKVKVEQDHLSGQAHVTVEVDIDERVL